MYMEAGDGTGRSPAGMASAASCAGGEIKWAEPRACLGACKGLGACATTTAHEMAESLGRAVDARDRRLFRHSEVVADLASLLAQAHGLTSRQTQLVHMAGHLHDVGKIGIPDHILRKPGPLTAQEWEIMRLHPRIGAEILRPVHVFCGRPGVCEIVLAHHERFDGTGYPFGLRGAKIPLGARIVAVADAFSAMTETRPYRKALILEEAVAELRRGAGSMFDPDVVRDLLSLCDKLPGLLETASQRAGQDDLMRPSWPSRAPG
jgi:HD-GYP domain-containing protein (c-di-GMP phosphodiesterase class II)